MGNLISKWLKQICHFKLPTVTFPEDVLTLMKIDNEAEWEAYYDQLNQFVLLAFYVILLSISLLLRELQYFN
ncbi:hypothetical protein [Streptococcus intermedius]|uniref:hypothetical protein n=1 Tax=Streptococcus intermedius TaxID=1338 RepID=UPI00041024FC|nr:hypothetical protein [Streptococcus intermedius]